MGRETTYPNPEHRGYTSLARQPVGNDYHGVENGNIDHLRNDYIKNADMRVDYPRGDYTSTAGMPYNYTHNGPGVDVYRKGDMFEDCATFVREACSDIFGKMELQKFERNPYRSRYLNTPECEIMLTKHCQRLLHSYYDRAEALCSNIFYGGLTHMSFDEISASGLASNDHMSTITTLSILARYYKIGYFLPQTVDSSSSTANLLTYVLNVIRAIYAAAWSSSAGVSAPAKWNSVDVARRFYALLGRGVWQSTPEGDDLFPSLDRRVAQRICLLYALCLHLLDVILSNSPDSVEDFLGGDCDLYDTIGCVACCFVEQAVRSGDRAGYMIPGSDLPEDRLAPDIEDRKAIFSKHWSVLSGLLSCGVRFGNSDLLVKGVKALCNMLESSNSGRSLLLWAYCVYVRLCPTELSQNTYSIPRILFEYMTKCRSVLQLKAVTNALAVCMRDPGFARYADDRMNPQKTFATFVLHSCNLIHNKMDDLAVPILQMLHLLFDTCPKTLPDISSTMSGAAGLLERYSDTVGNAVETFLNVATLSLGPIQVIMALIMRRVLLRSDVTKSLTGDLRAKFVKHLLAMVGFRKPSGVTPMDATSLVSKVALLDGFVQAGGLPDLVAAMKDVNAKQLRLVALHTSSVSCEFLHKSLCIGDIATKLVAYDALAGYRSDTMDAGTFVLCALCSAVKMCPGVSALLREYACTYASMSEYHGAGNFPSEAKFLRAISNDSALVDPARSLRAAALLSVHAIMSSIHMSSEACKQNLIHSLLCPEGASDQPHYELVAKYKAQLAFHRKEVVRSHARLDAQAQELQQHKAAAAKQLELMKDECAAKVERSRTDLATVQSQLSSAASQAQQLDRECAKLRTQVQELDQALRQVSAEKSHISDSLREANLNRDRLKSEVAGLQGQLEQRDKSISQLRSVESDNTRLNHEVGDLTAQVERVYRMLISLMSKHKQLESELSRSKEENEQTTHQLRDRQLQVDDLSSKCRNHEHTISSLRSAKDISDGEIERLRRELQSLETRLHKTTEDLDLLQGRFTQTSQSLQSYEDQNRRLNEQLQRCESQLRQRGEHLSTIYSTFQDKKPY
ncbi:hypothetical protein X943_001089 [Babesia divergens]|uniref:Uncharacterized protein n=1 Tax=Babesia divergens TaxID=32595 RepID=A0AAD9LI81_BABDI|nr:hypothetical protein X943_001089 [Babesia divergens]